MTTSFHKATPLPPTTLLSILTFVLWLLPLAIGLIGLRIPYPCPTPPALAPNPTQLVTIALSQTSSPPPETPLIPHQPEPIPSATPPAFSPIATPEAPPIAVVQPSPAIAFALPAEGFTRLVDPSQAAQARFAQSGQGTGSGAISPSQKPHLAIPKPASAPKPPAITNLTLGEGEGNQPVPDYPPEAINARQEGTVTLRLNVDQTGRVTSVELITPSRFLLLNRAAAKTVKERWHFPPGQSRTYQVPIQFQLNQ